MINPVVGAAALSALGQGINAYTTGKMNKRAEQFSYRMYAQQRADALTDWNNQNAYNDPSAQMKRLENAGLNPHLVYGNGANAQSQGAPRSASQSTPNFKAPQFDPGSVVFNALQAQQLQANIARTEAETARIDADTKSMIYQNQFLTPEMFAAEYDHRSSRAIYGADNERSTANMNRLKLETQNMINGYRRDNDSFNKPQTDRPGKNLTVEGMMQTLRNAQETKKGLELQNFMREYETSIIKQLGVSGNDAKSIMSNLFKLILMYTTSKTR